MKTSSTSSTLPQSNKDSFSPILKQLPIRQQSGLKLASNSPSENTSNQYSMRNKLHYRSNFQENNMQYQYFKIFFKDSDKKKHEVEIENDYEYSQTCDFVERVVRQMNQQLNLNLPSSASNYSLYFAKKNGSRNSSYPEIDMHNTNIQTAMKFHDKNLFRLKIKSSNSTRNSFIKENSLIASQNQSGCDDISISQSKVKQSSSSNDKILERSVLTNITNNTNSSSLTAAMANKNEIPDQKKIQKASIVQDSNSTGLFGCFRFC